MLPAGRRAPPEAIAPDARRASAVHRARPRPRAPRAARARAERAARRDGWARRDADPLRRAFLDRSWLLRVLRSPPPPHRPRLAPGRQASRWALRARRRWISKILASMGSEWDCGADID